MTERGDFMLNSTRTITGALVLSVLVALWSVTMIVRGVEAGLPLLVTGILLAGLFAREAGRRKRETAT